MKNYLPRLKQLKFPGGYVLSFRWRSYGYDLFQSKQYKLVQFGKKGQPLKFLCHVSDKAEKPPTFLYSSRWRHHYRSENLIAGETTKPLSLAKLWGGA